MSAYETDDLAQGCGKFMFVVFVVILCIVVGAFVLGKHC